MAAETGGVWRRQEAEERKFVDPALFSCEVAAPTLFSHRFN